MNAQELTAALVGVYARLRRGDLEASAARREASGFLAALREVNAQDEESRKGNWWNGRGRSASKNAAPPTRVEYVYIPGAYADAEIVRLTPDFEPWDEKEKSAQAGRLTPEDVELLEVNATARARRGEITEQTARAEAFVLKAIRYGLTPAPVAGAVTWGECKKAVAEEDLRENAITLFHHVPDEKELVDGPVITFVHGFAVAGQPDPEDAPPWPIWNMGKLTGYHVPKGWTKSEGEELAAMLKRIHAAHERERRDAR